MQLIKLYYLPYGDIMIIQNIKTRILTEYWYTIERYGRLSILPKPSASSIYGPVTHYTTQAIKDNTIEKDEKYDDGGMRLLTNSDGYECLFIYNGVWGFYMQTGVASRDPYTRYIKPRYIPPKYSKKNPLPWSYTIHNDFLIPIEHCRAVGDSVTVYTTMEDVENHKYVIKDENYAVLSGIYTERNGCVREQAASDNHLFEDNLLNIYPKTGQANSFTIHSHIYVVTAHNNLYGVTDATVKEQLHFHGLASMLPPPTNDFFILNNTKVPKKKRLTRTEIAYLNYFMPKFVDYIDVVRTNDKEPPYKHVSGSYVWERYEVDWSCVRGVLDSRLETKTYNLSVAKELGGKVGTYYYKPTMVDWPIITYTNTQRPHRLAWVKDITPCVFVPLMLYFKPHKADGCPIDAKTGRRLCDGQIVIAIITTDDQEKWYDEVKGYTFTLSQFTHPITKYPSYTKATNVKDKVSPEK